MKRVVAKHMVLMFSKFKTATCHRCQQKGHIRPVCQARLPESSFPRRSNNSRDMSVNSCEVNQEEDGDDSSFQMYENSTNSEDSEGFGLYRTGTDSMTVKPYVVSVQLGNATVSMEVDTGASRSTVSQYVYNTLLTDFFRILTLAYVVILVKRFPFWERFLFQLNILPMMKRPST